jgi:hypothetical protein
MEKALEKRLNGFSLGKTNEKCTFGVFPKEKPLSLLSRRKPFEIKGSKFFSQRISHFFKIEFCFHDIISLFCRTKMPTTHSKPLDAPDPNLEGAWEALLALGQSAPSKRTRQEAESELDEIALAFFDDQEVFDGPAPAVKQEHGQRHTAWLEFLDGFNSKVLYEGWLMHFLGYYEQEVGKGIEGRETWVMEHYLLQYLKDQR